MPFYDEASPCERLGGCQEPQPPLDLRRERCPHPFHGIPHPTGHAPRETPTTLPLEMLVNANSMTWRAVVVLRIYTEVIYCRLDSASADELTQEKGQIPKRQ